jgi:Arc/MetJ-type ribon-helix-helix transcriptional regulator
MRTTITLDDDVAAELERLRQARGLRFKNVINDVLRRGLREMSVRPKRHEAFRTKAVALGRVRLASIDNIGEVLAVAEGEAFK